MEANNRRRTREYRADESVPLKPGLVLRREVGEQILIGSDVVITLISTNGPYGQIHVHAPYNVAVDRAEVRRMKKITGIDNRRR